MPADWEVQTHFEGERCRPRIELLFKDVPHARFAMEFQEHQRFTNLVWGVKWLPKQAYRMAGLHEQTCTPDLQDQELASL